MFKKTLIFLSLLSLGIQSQAQKKINVAFIPMTFNESSINEVEARTIQEAVVNSFVSTKRFSVVDRSNLEALESEKKLQRTEAFMDSKETFTDGISKGASYLIEGSIISINHTGKKNKWKSNVAVQLKILDVSTGEIVSTEGINSTVSLEKEKNEKSDRAARFRPGKKKEKQLMVKELSENKQSQEASFQLAMQGLINNIQEFAIANFPIHVDLVEWVGKDAKTKVPETGPFRFFVVAAGDGLGMEVGQILDLVSPSEVVVNGKTIIRQNKIGFALITKVDDENFSTARVVSGEKDIKDAILNNQKVLVIAE